mgnify:CR=1 FL=1
MPSKMKKFKEVCSKSKLLASSISNQLTLLTSCKQSSKIDIQHRTSYWLLRAIKLKNASKLFGNVSPPHPRSFILSSKLIIKKSTRHSMGQETVMDRSCCRLSCRQWSILKICSWSWSQYSRPLNKKDSFNKENRSRFSRKSRKMKSQKSLLPLRLSLKKRILHLRIFLNQV